MAIKVETMFHVCPFESEASSHFNPPPGRRWRSRCAVVVSVPVRLDSVINPLSMAKLIRVFCQIWWGRWDSNPHELPRPLLRRLRLPFRHFPEELRLIRVEEASASVASRRCEAQMQLGRTAREDERDQLRAPRLPQCDVATSPARHRSAQASSVQDAETSSARRLSSTSPRRRQSPRRSRVARSMRVGGVNRSSTTSSSLPGERQRAVNAAALRQIGRVVRTTDARRGHRVLIAHVRAIEGAGRQRVRVRGDVIAGRRRLRIDRIAQQADARRGVAAAGRPARRSARRRSAQTRREGARSASIVPSGSQTAAASQNR